MSTANTTMTLKPSTAYRTHADELAAWAEKYLVNRTDVWGGYLPPRYRQRVDANGKVTEIKSVTKPRVSDRGKKSLTTDIMVRHFVGTSVGDVIGLHTTSIENTSKWFATEIDAHDENDQDAAGRNLLAAIHWRKKLLDSGFNVLASESNGRGGVHLLVILDSPAPTPDVFSFIQSIVADHTELGFDAPPETFPKQARIEPGGSGPGGCGNWLRVPGRHHTRNHWSQIWDGDKWLEGKDAVDAILTHQPSSAALIPKAPEPAIAEPAGPATKQLPPWQTTARNRSHKQDNDREREIARRCVGAIPNTATTDYDEWVRVGMALHHVFAGDGTGLELWIKWSSKSPKHVESECRRDWDCFSTNRAKKATLGTLVKLARDAGVNPFPTLATDDPEAIDVARQAVYAAIAQAYDDAEEDETTPAVAFNVACHMATLPPGERAEAIADLKAAIGSALNLNELRREVSREDRARRKARRKSCSELPEITTAGRPLRDISDDALKAIHEANKPPVIFTFAGEPARIRSDEHGIARPQIMNEAMVRGRMTRTAEYVVETPEGPVHVSPPMDAVRDIMVRADTEFPPLYAVVESPILRPDGSIFAGPGYDPATRVFLSQRPDRPPVIPIHHPTPEQIRAAIATILEPLKEFPFDGDASKANAVGMMFTPALRHHIGGCVPLGVADASTPGTGKSLLIDMISTTSIGELPTLISAASDETEWIKTLISFLSAGATFIKIDNVEGVLRSAALAAVLTAIEYTARELGRSKLLTVMQRATWSLTGNNVLLGGDLPRRCYHIRLDAHSSKPWMGRNFQHPDLLEWTRQNRHHIASAILTLCRGWVLAGKPAAPSSQPIIGGFENWSKTVGGILHWAGIPDFLGNLSNLYESNDETANEWATFLAAWRVEHAETAVTVSTIVGKIFRGESKSMREALPCELGKHLSDSNKFSQQFGLALRRYRGRRFGEDGLYIQREEDNTHGKVASWSIRRDYKSAGTEGTCGTCSIPNVVRPHTFQHTTHNNTPHESTYTHERYTSHKESDGEHSRNPPHSPQDGTTADAPEWAPDDYEAEERLAIQTEGM